MFLCAPSWSYSSVGQQHCREMVWSRCQERRFSDGFHLLSSMERLCLGVECCRIAIHTGGASLKNLDRKSWETVFFGEPNKFFALRLYANSGARTGPVSANRNGAASHHDPNQALWEKGDYWRCLDSYLEGGCADYSSERPNSASPGADPAQARTTH